MRLRPVLLAVVTVLCAVPRAFAEPIIITVGTVSLGSQSSPNVAPFGFQLTGEETSIGGITFDDGLSFVNAGQVINFSKTVSVSSTTASGPADQTVQGVVLRDVRLQGTLNFVAPPVTVTGDAPHDVNAPFTMNGILSFFGPGSPGEPVLTTAVMGSGRVFMNLIPQTGAPDLFAVGGTTYRFEPVAATATPEPGTLVLIGSGLLVVARRLRYGKT